MSLRLLALLLLLFPFAAQAAGAFPPALDSYGDAGLGVGAKLVHRIRTEPVNLIASLIFLAAIVHTFLVARFRHVACAANRELQLHPGAAHEPRAARLRFRATLFHFL